MEIKRKNNAETNSDSNEKKGLFEKIFKSLEEEKEGTFYNVRNELFHKILALGDIRSAIVNMKCEESFLSYKLTFSIIYVLSDGTPKKSDKFLTTTLLGGPVGLVPKYIKDAVKNSDDVEICFDYHDLENLYNELNVKITEEIEWSSILDECNRIHGNSLKLTDRVFYTKVEFLDASGSIVDVQYYADIKGVPQSLQSDLYPCKQVEYSL